MKEHLNLLKRADSDMVIRCLANQFLFRDGGNWMLQNSWRNGGSSRRASVIDKAMFWQRKKGVTETRDDYQCMRNICGLNWNWLKPYKALSIRARTPKMYNNRDSRPSSRAIHSIVQYHNPNERR